MATTSKRRTSGNAGKAKSAVGAQRNCFDWSISVDGFGRISRSHITMAPLVLLVGRNNTGKSFMASLIWSLLSSHDLLRKRIGAISRPIPQWFQDIYAQTLETGEMASHTVTESELSQMNDYVNAAVISEKGQFFKDLFSTEKLNSPQFKFFIGNSGKGIVVTFRSEVIPTFAQFTHGEGDERLRSYNYTLSKNRKIGSSFNVTLFHHFLMSIVSGIDEIRGEPVYIPAARTGLMLAYRPLVSGLLDKLGISQAESGVSSLSLPTIRFLQALTQKERGTKATKMQRIARDLEASILSGEIRSSRADIPDFSYHPSDRSDGLPLHVASSMVTELAPFLLLLKAGMGDAGIVFEEPEAHLHLSAQRQMARAIARLVNAGIPVVVTSHSDTFVQQINNLMHIATHPRRAALMKRFGYSKDELIYEGQARAYEFTEGDSGTVVHEVERIEQGFIIPSLNETIFDLTEETIELQA